MRKPTAAPKFSIIDEASIGERESEVFTRSLLSQFEQYVQLGKKVPAEVLSSLQQHR